MLISIALGGFTVFITMSLQVVFVVLMLGYLINIMERDDWIIHGFGTCFIGWPDIGWG